MYVCYFQPKLHAKSTDGFVDLTDDDGPDLIVEPGKGPSESTLEKFLDKVSHLLSPLKLSVFGGKQTAVVMKSNVQNSCLM